MYVCMYVVFITVKKNLIMKLNMFQAVKVNLTSSRSNKFEGSSIILHKATLAFSPPLNTPIHMIGLIKYDYNI